MLAAIITGVMITALPAIGLFLPTAILLLTERDPSRPLTRAVSLFGVAGAWDTLGMLWQFGGLGGLGWSTTSWLIGLDTHRLTIAWAAQGGAWLLAEAITIALAQIANQRAAALGDQAEQRRAALASEWGQAP
jgi:hypothetical protein